MLLLACDCKSFIKRIPMYIYFSELLKRKQKAIDDNNTHLLAQTCRKLGDLYHDNQQYDDALAQYQEEAKAYRALNKATEAGLANRMIGEMYMLLEKFDEALHYEQKYLSMSYGGTSIFFLKLITYISSHCRGRHRHQ